MTPGMEHHVENALEVSGAVAVLVRTSESSAEACSQPKCIFDSREIECENTHHVDKTPEAATHEASTTQKDSVTNGAPSPSSALYTSNEKDNRYESDTTTSVELPKSKCATLESWTEKNEPPSVGQILKLTAQSKLTVACSSGEEHEIALVEHGSVDQAMASPFEIESGNASNANIQVSRGPKEIQANGIDRCLPMINAETVQGRDGDGMAQSLPPAVSQVRQTLQKAQANGTAPSEVMLSNH